MKESDIYAIVRNYVNTVPEGRTQATRYLINAGLYTGLELNVLSLGFPHELSWHIRFLWHLSPNVFGITTIPLPIKSYPSFMEAIRLDDLLSVFQVIRVLMRRDCKILYVLNVEPVYFALALRVLSKVKGRSSKFVTHLFNSPMLWNLSARFIERGIYDHVLCTSRSLKRHLSNIISDSRVHYVPYPIDTESFQPRDKHETRKLLELPLDVNIIGYVGHTTVERGAFNLIKALSKLSRNERDFLLVVVAPPHTETEPLEEFTNLTRRLNLETRILDKVISVELFYNAVDVLALPFRQPYLPIDPPVTIVEALSSGTPLITTPVGAIKEVVNEERGLLVEPGNTDMLKDALEYLLSDEKTRRRLSLNSREYVVKNLSLEVIGQRIKGIFESILLEA